MQPCTEPTQFPIATTTSQATWTTTSSATSSVHAKFRDITSATLDKPLWLLMKMVSSLGVSRHSIPRLS
uniref:Uncharacterized protein n=1 Tax=Oryza nivara TaxID=4536 RepID=A0A0E0GFQ8_ORYNI